MPKKKSFNPILAETRELDRRKFLFEMAAMAAAVSIPTIPRIAFGGPSRQKLVVVFLRGGADGLSMLSPLARGAQRANSGVYQNARPTLVTSGAIPLAGADFGLHPKMASLRPLYNSGDLVFIQGAGSTNNTRSHFEQQDLIEYGNPDKVARVHDGYLNRALGLLNNESGLPAVGLGPNLPKVLRGREPSLVLPENLSKIGALPTSTNRRAQLDILQRTRLSWIGRPENNPRRSEHLAARAGARLKGGLEAIANTIDLSKVSDADQYGVHKQFRTAAFLLSTQPDLQFLNIDVDAWDTHRQMGVNSGYFSGHVEQLAIGLSQFASDLKKNGMWNRTTIVVMTEFGRRVAQNGSEGLDHGRGGLMMVLGGNVAGKQVITDGTLGNFNLQTLDTNGDINVTVDYRHVIAEILHKNIGLSKGQIRNTVFPAGFTYRDLSIIKS